MERIIDLTLTYEPAMPGVAFAPAKTLDEDGWNATTLSLYSHAGTHMDAPIHFGVPGPTIDQLPLESCIGQAWVADLTHIGAGGLMAVADLGPVAERLAPGDSLLLKTGWSQYVGQAPYREALPRVGVELAEWCVARQVKMLGVEPPSVADVNNLAEVAKIHHILLSGGIVIIEGLTNLGKIQSNKVQLYAFPLKIKGGDGAPARVVAIEKTA